MKLRTLLIDDEPNCLSILKDHLIDFQDKIDIVGTANSAIRGLAQIDELNPDLIFLDVSMPGGTGFEMLDQARKRSFDIIFTSAHGEYAIDAFDYSAVNFLLKPIDTSKLQKAIQQIPNENQTAKNKFETDEKISVNCNKGHQIVKLKNIIYCEGDGGYTSFYLEGGAKLVSSTNLKVYEDKFANCYFDRIHKKYLINLEKVKYFTKGKGGHVTLSNGHELSISYRQKGSFLKKMQNHINSK